MLDPSREESGCSQFSYASEDYEDEDMFEDEDEPAATRREEPHETVMSGLDLVKEQNEQIGQIASLFEVPPVNASVLLRKFHWNVEKLIEQYYDDPARVLEKAGISVKRQKSGGPSDEGGGSDEITCLVCFCDVPRAESSPNDRCGHRFCNDCWAGHLGVQIKEGNANAIVCMADKCSALVELALVQALVDAPTFAQYARFAQKQFVDENPFLKWCPAAGCENVIKVRDLGRAEVRCSCSMLFCFGCVREAHFPLTCEQLNSWEDKNASDAGTGQWMQANTKRCKKCNVRVEKNGGCNWISCKCGHQFCYFCHSTDPGHHGQPCNAPPSKDEQSAQSELDYYMHYFDRWNGHRLSQQFETKLREDAMAKMDELVADNSATHLLSEVQHLADATETLIECRRVLKSTYPFAFYLDKGSEKDLFENLQARLEGQTELLSAALEAKEAMQPDTFTEHRQKLVLLSSDARLRLQHLRSGVEEGLLAVAAPSSSSLGAASTSAAGGSAGDPIVL